MFFVDRPIIGLTGVLCWQSNWFNMLGNWDPRVIILNSSWFTISNSSDKICCQEISFYHDFFCTIRWRMNCTVNKLFNFNRICQFMKIRLRVLVIKDRWNFVFRISQILSLLILSVLSTKSNTTSSILDMSHQNLLFHFKTFVNKLN